MENQENIITTYVRTLQHMSCNRSENTLETPVFVSYKDLRQFTNKPKRTLNRLCKDGELRSFPKKGKNGKTYLIYAARIEGDIDISLVKEPVNTNLDSVLLTMRNYLKDVSLRVNSPRSVYFDLFLRFKKYSDLFFKVDNFGKRVYTPITSLKKIWRRNILIDGEETLSIDVACMQPTILASILKEKIGKNQFSEWIESGVDVYEKLQHLIKLKDREAAKKFFLTILFARPKHYLIGYFGDRNWIQWINDFKSNLYKPNPRSKQKRHSNLAFLLQSFEVECMKKVWSRLIESGIKFLSVHDEIIVKVKDLEKSKEIMQEVLNEKLIYVELKINK